MSWGRWLLGAMVCTGMMIHGQTLRTRQIPQSQEELHARVVALYDFHPVRVSAAVRKAKSAEMDVFWDEMKAQPEITVPLLRAELRTTGDPGFFYTDGLELLLSLSKDKQDKVLAAAVLPRMDLEDTDPTTYFYTAHDLAVDGEDITAGALHILDRPGFRVSVPQHAMVLDQRMALMYLLLSMPENLWVKGAVQRLGSETDEQAKLALVFALFYAQTNDADAVLKRIAADPAQPEALRAQTKDLLSGAQTAGKSWMPVRGTVPEIRAKRRQRLAAVSDEAVDDVQWMTQKIVELRAKGKG